MDGFIVAFEEIKINILESILGQKFFTISKWHLCCQGLKEGGLGMQFVDCVGYAAYVASMFECWQVVASNFSSDEYSEENSVKYLNMIDEFNKSLQVLANIENKSIPFKLNDLVELYNKKGKQSFQNTLYEIIKPKLKNYDLRFDAS